MIENEKKQSKKTKQKQKLMKKEPLYLCFDFMRQTNLRTGIKDALMGKLILRGKTKNKRSELEYEEEEEGDKRRLPITLDNRENPGVTL